MLVAILAAAATAFGCGGLLRTILLVPVSTLVLHPPSARDQFFNLVATDFKQPALCNRIDWRADASIRGWDTPHRIRTMRSACRSNLELPPNADLFSGAGDNAGVRGPGARARIHGCGRAQAAHTAGYPATPIYAVYRGLLSNDEFRSRLRAASDYGEARNRARLRPAGPIELMYQMVAVDASEAALCSKISPNATFDDEGSPLALLQSRCYLHIAFNTRDIRSCDPLPAAARFHTSTRSTTRASAVGKPWPSTAGPISRAIPYMDRRRFRVRPTSRQSFSSDRIPGRHAAAGARADGG